MCNSPGYFSLPVQTPYDIIVHFMKVQTDHFDGNLSLVFIIVAPIHCAERTISQYNLGIVVHFILDLDCATLDSSLHNLLFDIRSFLMCRYANWSREGNINSKTESSKNCDIGFSQQHDISIFAASSIILLSYLIFSYAELLKQNPPSCVEIENIHLIYISVKLLTHFTFSVPYDIHPRHPHAQPIPIRFKSRTQTHLDSACASLKPTLIKVSLVV